MHAMTYRVPFETILQGLRERLDEEDLAEVCDLLIWRTPDNGAELLDVCEKWLRNGTAEEVSAALAVNGGIHFQTRDEREREMRAVAERFPQFRERVERILRDWDEKQKPRAVREVLQDGSPPSRVAYRYRITEERLRAWIDEYLRENPASDAPS
ncbi:transposase [Thermomonospora curvata]|nr:transposase [Thermomonospora curvata]